MDAIGGGVLVAVAAALWVAYLLPTWFRRGQYLATERNAVRLQQTLRILAETAETPEEVRVEATAREVAAQQRILAEQNERRRLEAEAAEQLAIAERVAAEQKAAAARAVAERAASRARAEARARTIGESGRGADAAPADLRRALRRRRATSSLIMLASLFVAVVGLVGLPFGWSPIVAMAGAAGTVLGATGVVLLARRRVPVASVIVEAPVVAAAPFEPIDLPETIAEPAAGWTPQPLPKPLHLSRGTIAAAAMASVEAAERLRRASVDAQLAERAAKLEPEVPRLTPRPAPAQPAATAATVNPYAGMGVIADAEPGMESLDAVLRRRRQAV